MNKMNTIAKIGFVMLGIYLIVPSIYNLLRSLSYISYSSVLSHSQNNILFWAILGVSVLASLGYIVAIFYFLIYRPNIIAKKIVPHEELSDSSNPAYWYPFALRLTVMIAGFFFLYKTIGLLGSSVGNIYLSLQPDGSMRQFYETLAYGLVYLAIAIYLLCGAPHFVRWQMRKTREFCNRFSALQHRRS